MWTFNHHSTICGKDYFLPIELPWHFVKDQLTMNVRIYVWTPNCFILIYVSFLLPVPLYFDYCIIIVSFEMENISLPTLLLFFKMVLAIFSPLHFNINFKNSLSISAKMPAGVLIEITVQINLRRIAILTILSVSIECFSIYSHFISFFSTMSYSFWYMGIVLLLLNLIISIFFHF